MSGNMWAELLKLRKRGKLHAKGAAPATLEALVTRRFAAADNRPALHLYRITDLGRMVADAYTEGQEAKA